MDGRSYKFKLITVSISGHVLARFRYTDQSGKDKAIQRALEIVFDQWLGSDVNPWPYIKGV